MVTMFDYRQKAQPKTKNKHPCEHSILRLSLRGCHPLWRPIPRALRSCAIINELATTTPHHLNSKTQPFFKLQSPHIPKFREDS